MPTTEPTAKPSDSSHQSQPNTSAQTSTPQPTESNFAIDSDSDGLTDSKEAPLGTNPLVADTDSDGLNDGLEVNTYKTNPLVADSDSDNLNDGLEVTSKTNPLLADTDADGVNDGLEVNTYKTDPLISDTDSDGLNDGLEVNGWKITVNKNSLQVISDPLLPDSDDDSLADASEFFLYGTNPKSADTDSDGLPDKWEISFSYTFSPINSRDGLRDLDSDGLTNADEYRLNTLTLSGNLSFMKDLFFEIDYMYGFKPTPEAVNYLVSYYNELGIRVHVTIDDCIYETQLVNLGITPDQLDVYECYKIESIYHDFSETHVYVFYAKCLSKSEVLGWASEFGAFLNMETIKQQEGISVLWLTDSIRTEKTVLLHEVGHTLNVLITDEEGYEDYCSNLGCIMSAADDWQDILGGISQLVVLHSEYPRYCDTHRALIDLTDKWSVDESWVYG